MRTPFLLLGLAAILQSQEPALKLPFAPALYTLRATAKEGSSLILLDETGRETVIDKDPRKARGGGGFSSSPFQASFYGVFSGTTGFQKVLFTRYGDADAPSLGINRMGGFVHKTFTSSFGERDLDSIRLWDRSTGKSEVLWTSDQLKDQLADWVKTPEGTPYQKVNLDDELKANRSSYLFQLQGGRFAFLSGASIFELDIQTKKVRLLYSDLAQDKPSGAAKFFLGAREKAAQFAAWQELDGSITALRPGVKIQVGLDGKVETTPLPKGHRVANLAHGLLAITDGKELSIATPGKEPAAPMKQENSLLQAAEDGQSLFAYHHSFSFKEWDFITRLDLEGKPLWTRLVTNGPFGLLLVEDGDHVRALVRRKPGDQPYRIIIDATTGKEGDADLWTREAVKNLEQEGMLPAPIDLADTSLLLPTKSGFLVWTPSRGVMKSAPAGSWVKAVLPSAEDTGESVPTGTWSWLDRQLRLRPLYQRPLADQIVVMAGERPLPLFNWINNGVAVGAPASDRIYSTKQDQGFPFYPRDYAAVTPPLATTWAEGLQLPVPSAPH